MKKYSSLELLLNSDTLVNVRNGTPGSAEPEERQPQDHQELTLRAERTRALLVSAALDVFSDRGYHRTRITDITKAAGVAVGSFYTYFGAKEEIFESAIEAVEDEVLATPSRPRSTSPGESIHVTNRLYMHAFARHARFWAMLEEAAMTNELARQVITARQSGNRKRTESALRRWMAAGAIPRLDNVAFTAQALGAMTERCAYLWFVFGEPVDPDTAADQVTTIWYKVLGLGVNGASP